MFAGKIISIIVAMDENGLIGNNGNMPWFIKSDLSYFKKMTLNHSVIMGRKTFEAIGKPLSNRENIIISKTIKYKEACLVCDDICQAIRQAKSKEVFIIGGASIYQETLSIFDNLYLTKIHHIFKGDTYFPKLDLDDLKLIDCFELFDQYQLEFKHYKRH